MIPDLAYAESIDSSNSSLSIVVIGVGILAIAAVAALVPICICRRRHHRQTETITALALFWGLLTASSVIYIVNAQMKWSHEQLLRIESGYYDPQDQSDAPTKPLKTWLALSVGYAGLMVWSVAQKNPAPAPLPFAQRSEPDRN